MREVIGLRHPSNLTGDSKIVFLPDQRQAGFTARDLHDLGLWSSDKRRVVICNGEMGTFAMVYDDAAPCASFGFVRQGREVLLWNCVTLADIGRFASISAALAAVPGAIADELDLEISAPANIIPFAAAAARLRPQLIA